MRRRRFRFTLWTLMLVVAASAGVMGLVRRSQRLQAIAADHARKAQECADVAWGMQRLGPRNPENNQAASKFWNLHEYHRQLSDKYQRAARRPWFPVVSDATPPEG